MSTSAMAMTSMPALLKEIGRVKIELNACTQGSDMEAQLQAKLEVLMAEHAAAGVPKAKVPTPTEPEKSAREMTTKSGNESRPKQRPKAKGQSELDRWLQKQRRKASEDGLNFSGGGAVSTADVAADAKKDADVKIENESASPGLGKTKSFSSGRPGNVDAFQGLVLSTEGSWSLHSTEGSFIFEPEDGWLREKDSQEKLGQLTLAKIQEQPLSLDFGNDFSKLHCNTLRIISSEIMSEIQKPENDQALFVLPSQLNGAEYPSHTSIKYQVVDYKYDNTGGPRGQLAAHPAVAQFLLDNAANVEREGGINAVDELLHHVTGLEVVNGYLKIQEGDETAKAMTIEQLQQHLHLLRPIVMDQVSASGLTPDKRERSSSSHKVGLVYASAIPVDSYLNRDSNIALEHQKAVAELILLAQYLGALRYAASTGRRKVFLMPLGGGVFNNPWDLIAKSMARAVQMMDDSDLSMLDIYALTWQESDEATKLQEIFLTLNSNYLEFPEGPGGRVSFSHPDDVRHFHTEDSPKAQPLAIHGPDAQEDTVPAPEAASATVEENTVPAPKAASATVEENTLPAPEAASATVEENTVPAPEAASATVEENNVPAPEAASGTVEENNVPAPEAASATVEENTVPAPEAASATVEDVKDGIKLPEKKPTSLASLAVTATQAKAKSKASSKVMASPKVANGSKANATAKVVQVAGKVMPKTTSIVKPKVEVIPKAKASAKVEIIPKAKASAKATAKAHSQGTPPPAESRTSGTSLSVAVPKAKSSTAMRPKTSSKSSSPSQATVETKAPAKVASPAKAEAKAKAKAASTFSPRFSPPARVASQTALEKKAKEMEKNVKAAQAACLRDADNRTSSGRLKSLEVEAATLRRKLQAAESQPAAPAAQASASSSASPTPVAVESGFGETSRAEAAPTIEPEEVAPVPDNRRSPRSTSSSLRLKLESLVQEEDDDEQLAVEVHKVLVAEGALVAGVTSSAASSTSRVSPPRSPSDSPRKGKGRGKAAPKTASDVGLEVPRKTSSPEKQKPSPRPELENRPAWDDRFYVMEVPKPKRRSSLEEEHLAKDEVPKVSITRSPRPSPTATTHGQSGPSTEVPKRSPKAKVKAQEKAKAKASPAVKALSAASFAAERQKRQVTASR